MDVPPLVHLSTVLEPDARVLVGRDLDSDAGSWFLKFYLFIYFYRSVHLTLPKSWLKPAFWGCFLWLSVKSPWSQHMWRWFAPLCQRWAERKGGITFWKCSDSFMRPPSAPCSEWWPHKNASVFASNGGTNPSWKAVSATHVQAGTTLK